MSIGFIDNMTSFSSEPILNKMATIQEFAKIHENFLSKKEEAFSKNDAGEAERAAFVDVYMHVIADYLTKGYITPKIEELRKLNPRQYFECFRDTSKRNRNYIEEYEKNKS